MSTNAQMHIWDLRNIKKTLFYDMNIFFCYLDFLFMYIQIK